MGKQGAAGPCRRPEAAFTFIMKLIDHPKGADESFLARVFG